MGENKREYMPVRRYTFPAGVCGGEIRVTIPVSVGQQFYHDCMDMQK